ncbi:head-tail connector protein [Methylocystis heyeri]|uniref:Phage gp6-like head-tail connector protein n=1 Tax=Methylocystis heyeri TaxID=391905 RepID=A0A6B8KGB4_9HYPH|nr:head-tail connector protein [Methylocystis heyeri]QGM46659.1 phage gp6-like head-tail connector protein [Methylocystis heyeri]
MSILTLDDFKAHANIITTDEDAMIQGKIDAAEAWVGSFIGQSLSSYPTQPPDAPIMEAVKQLAAHLYNNRESVFVGTSIADNCPGLSGLLAPYRQWNF